MARAVEHRVARDDERATSAGRWRPARTWVGLPVQKPEKRGFLRRVSDKPDARRTLVGLTRQGKEVHDAIMANARQAPSQPSLTIPAEQPLDGSRDREFPMTGTTTEQRADVAVHVAGLCLGLAGAPLMLAAAIDSPQRGEVVPAALYVAGLIAMLACSATYNVWRSCRRREWLRRLDHAAIFVMIAGTYTPLAVRLPGAWSVALTGGVWAAAAAGVVLKLCQPRCIEAVSVVLYLVLGWVGLVALEPLIGSVDGTALWLLLAGGIVYSAGVAFHLAHTLRYGRALWHGCVLTAAAVHYVALLSIVGGQSGAG